MELLQMEIVQWGIVAICIIGLIFFIKCVFASCEEFSKDKVRNNH